MKKKNLSIFNDFTVGMMLIYYELVDMYPKYHAELYIENGVIYYDN